MQTSAISRHPAIPTRSTRTATISRSARQAADIWAARLRSNPKDFESAWKLARACYWLGASRARRRAQVRFSKRGIAAGRTAAALEPNRPEGHFWIAANMGALAESFGLRQGLKYRGEIKDELLTVAATRSRRSSRDRPTARSAAGTTRCRACLAAATRKSEEHLRQSLTYNPEQHRLALLPRRGPDRDQA